MAEDKFHYFLFCFMYYSDTGSMITTSRLTGYSKYKISATIIKELKINSHIPVEALLLSVSYLGRMTEGEAA